FDTPSVDDAFISARGTYLVARMTHSASVWRLDTGALVSKPMDLGAMRALRLVALSPDERRAVVVTTARMRSEVRLWGPTLARPTLPPLALDDEVIELRHTPDGSALAVVTVAGDVHLLDGLNFTPVAPPFRRFAEVQSPIRDPRLDFSGDGRRLLVRDDT